MSKLNNKKASFEYEKLAEYEAGIVLTGPETKAYKLGKGSGWNGPYCYFNHNELFIKGLMINSTERPFKLLLTRHELNKLQSAVQEKGLTIVPKTLFVNEKRLIKVEIWLCKGKHTYDKRQAIKERDIKRDMKREG